MEKDALLAEAKKYIPDCDYIVDLYDLLFQWASPRALEMTGYSMDEILTMSNMDIADDRYDETTLRKELIERIAKKHGEKEYVIKSKQNKKLLIRFAYQVFTYGSGWYIVGKLLSAVPAKN